jgi:hypothetical protein
MLGDLPSDFLRIQLLESQIYDPFLSQQEHHQDPNFLGHFTLTIAEVIIHLIEYLKKFTFY